MKSYKFLPLLLTMLFLGFCQANYSESNDKYAIINQAVIESVKSLHYAPKPVDDSFSETVFKEYLKRLDYYKRFLLQGDVELLEEYKTKIDDDINGNTLEFFEYSNDLITRRIKEAAAYYKDILAKPFNFNEDEEYILDPDDYKFASSAAELKESWRKSLKYETMARLVGDVEMYEKEKGNKDSSEKSTIVTSEIILKKIKPYDSLEKNARERVSERYKNYFHRLEQYSAEDRFADYMNTIVGMFDPHTGYFPPKEKEDFDIGISGSLEGIGAILTQRDEFVKVESLVPGGPAYKQGELKAGDLILKVAQGQNEPVDVVDMRLDDAVRLIRGKKGTEVRLTVKKTDGAQKIISITRDIVYREDAFAKSSVIKQKGSDDKIGYIKLPSFYMDFNKSNGRRSSTDMKDELIKLGKEKIKGLVLDLRDNGGGSLQDAVDIAGLFFESGPVVQVSSQNGNPMVLADRDPNVYYSGPLVILVNEGSASASEILAAAMQDYGRAVIIGDLSTFGKGTVQRFVPLDNPYYNRDSKIEPGELKITTQKFYRINGGSTQLKGVIPDIMLPDEYKYIDVGEREMDNAMPWDKIGSVAYNTFPLISSIINRVKEMSKVRVQGDEQFRLIDENAMRLKKLRDMKSYPLNINKFCQLRAKEREEIKKFENIGKKDMDFSVLTPADDLPKIESDTTFKAKNDDWHKSLKTDMYLNEALNVLKDMVNLAAKK